MRSATPTRTAIAQKAKVIPETISITTWEMRQDIELGLSRLETTEREICSAIRNGETLDVIEARLQLSRVGLTRALSHIRQVFTNMGMINWLTEEVP